MKRKILNIALVALLPIVFSCSDDRLDLEPEINQIFTGIIKSEDQLEYATNAIYTALGSSSVFGADIIVNGDIISDNVFTSTTNDGYYLTENGMEWNAVNNPFAGEWRGLYTVVQRANIVINENKLEQTNKVKSLKGEAKISRGLAYFYLVQMFSPSVTSGQNQEYGVPLILKLSENGDPVYQVDAPRATVSAVYDQIIKDLTEGIEEMTETRGSKSFLSPTVGKYLLSKVYLTRGGAENLTKSVQLAQEALSVGGDYELFQATGTTAAQQAASYLNYFSSSTITVSENQKETLFEIAQTEKNNLGINSHLGAFYSSSGAHKSLLLRRSVFELFNNNTTDVRRTTMLAAGTPNSDNPTGVWSRKWSAQTSKGKYTANIKVFRLTELLFIQMEALAKLGRNAEALTLLNDFALNKRKGKIYTGTNLLNDILTERNKEFFTEGHRFFDLKRNNLPINKGTNCTTCNVSANDKLFVMPIDRVELRKNPVITQYPGWDQ